MVKLIFRKIEIRWGCIEKKKNLFSNYDNMLNFVFCVYL